MSANDRAGDDTPTNPQVDSSPDPHNVKSPVSAWPVSEPAPPAPGAPATADLPPAVDPAAGESEATPGEAAAPAAGTVDATPAGEAGEPSVTAARVDIHPGAEPDVDFSLNQGDADAAPPTDARAVADASSTSGAVPAALPMGSDGPPAGAGDPTNVDTSSNPHDVASTEPRRAAGHQPGNTAAGAAGGPGAMLDLPPASAELPDRDVDSAVGPHDPTAAGPRGVDTPAARAGGGTDANVSAASESSHRQVDTSAEASGRGPEVPGQRPELEKSTHLHVDTMLDAERVPPMPAAATGGPPAAATIDSPGVAPAATSAGGATTGGQSAGGADGAAAGTPADELAPTAEPVADRATTGGHSARGADGAATGTLADELAATAETVADRATIGGRSANDGPTEDLPGAFPRFDYARSPTGEPAATADPPARAGRPDIDVDHAAGTPLVDPASGELNGHLSEAFDGGSPIAPPVDPTAEAASTPDAPALGAPAASGAVGEEGDAADDDLDDPERLRAALEAVLLVVDTPTTAMLLAQVLGKPVGQVEQALGELRDEYDMGRRGIDLREVAGGWRLYTRAEFAAHVERFVLEGQQTRLTQAALETLAVIAYRQPITRSRVSAIRGVNVDAVMRTLLTRGLVEECGSDAETGGGLYRTTQFFLERLGISSLEELPSLAPLLPDTSQLDDVALST